MEEQGIEDCCCCCCACDEGFEAKETTTVCARTRDGDCCWGDAAAAAAKGAPLFAALPAKEGDAARVGCCDVAVTEGRDPPPAEPPTVAAATGTIFRMRSFSGGMCPVASGGSEASAPSPQVVSNGGRICRKPPRRLLPPPPMLLCRRCCCCLWRAATSPPPPAPPSFEAPTPPLPSPSSPSLSAPARPTVRTSCISATSANVSRRLGIGLGGGYPAPPPFACCCWRALGLRRARGERGEAEADVLRGAGGAEGEEDEEGPRATRGVPVGSASASCCRRIRSAAAPNVIPAATGEPSSALNSPSSSSCERITSMPGRTARRSPRTPPTPKRPAAPIPPIPLPTDPPALVKARISSARCTPIASSRPSAPRRRAAVVLGAVIGRGSTEVPTALMRTVSSMAPPTLAPAPTSETTLQVQR